MCKPTSTITAKVEELMELRKLAEELQNQMDAITDEIKAYMQEYRQPRRDAMATAWKNRLPR